MSDLFYRDFSTDTVAQQMRHLEFIRQVYVYQSISSTNAVAQRLAEAGSPSGTLVVADQQTAGRGRMGRVWQSQPGLGLWFSLLLRPASEVGEWYLLPMVLCETLALTFIDLTKKQFSVKWPNDILFKNRKLCGILCETNTIESKVSYIIAGIGINVNHTETLFPESIRGHATSLRMIAGHEFGRVGVLEAVLARLSATLQPMLEGERPIEIHHWNALNQDLGKRVVVRSGEQRVRGIFREVSKKGELLLEDSKSRLHRFSYGQATIERER